MSHPDGFPTAVERSSSLVDRYSAINSGTLILQKELERYYLRCEGAIRERVLVLDQIQANISDERRCLEVQHQECRSQISATRKLQGGLYKEQSKISDVIARAVAVMNKEERTLDEELAAMDEKLAEQSRIESAALVRRERYEAEEEALEARERQMFEREKDLEKALRELKNLSDEVTERKLTLEKKEGNIDVWNRALESRETELIRCQEQFTEDLHRLEEDEKRYGIVMSGSNVAPLVSKRQVMDDNNMTIEHENDCEEIDLDDEDN